MLTFSQRMGLKPVRSATHGGIHPTDVDQALAQYLLVSCSAFVNYLISKGIGNANRK